MICQKCQTPLKEGAQFCPECGEKVENPKAHASEEKGQKEKKPFWTTKMITLVTICVLILATATTFYIIGSTSIDPEQTVTDFKNAVLNEDVDLVTQLLDPTVADWTFSNADAQALINYLNAHENDRDYVFDALETQASAYADGNRNAAVSASILNDGQGSIGMSQEGKKWLLFDDYRIKITPLYLNITVNEDEAQLTINGREEVDSTTADEKIEFGPVSPGTYDIEAFIEGRYVDAIENVTVNLFQVGSFEQDIKIEFDLETVIVSAPYDETKVYINEQETDYTVGPEGTDIGRLPLDGTAKIVLEREFPWYTMTSDDIDVDSESINFNGFIAMPDEEMEKVMEMLNENWHQMLEAIATGNVDDMEYASDDLKERTRKQYETFANANNVYNYTFLEAKYVQETLQQPKYNDHTNRYELPVRVEYQFDEPDSNLYAIFRDGDLNRTPYEVLTYYDEENEQWLVENYDVSHFVITGSTQIFPHQFEGLTSLDENAESNDEEAEVDSEGEEEEEGQDAEENADSDEE
ncbi:zinc ribbon domain-containing protein [Alkalihalobacillus pseudalcaliphilus]|uniref:zinc ribbon domain-containing protein n=1 Tax=Alkalihalobacillus pseudalcaliphilus TaxID=79884 RepID=UPI00064E1499|nr:zinc-ribbon domain-containing protein [Alkalihalobacillus pseudalcaliphilus]KMK78241.1 hypothetical protein AB990_02050 [Alkalihalobacillus pseudalcaliphilus]